MKVLEKLNRLNGWQRIFCAFIAFIYFPIAVYLISEEKYNDRITESQILKIISKELLTEIVNKKAFLDNSNAPKGFIPDVYLEPEKFMVIDYNFGYYLDYKLIINKDVGEARAKVMGEDFGKALANEYSKKSFWARLEQFFFFLMVATAIYMFGWTLGWIKKGFSENRK